MDGKSKHPFTSSELFNAFSANQNGASSQIQTNNVIFENMHRKSAQPFSKQEPQLLSLNKNAQAHKASQQYLSLEGERW